MTQPTIPNDQSAPVCQSLANSSKMSSSVLYKTGITINIPTHAGRAIFQQLLTTFCSGL